MIKLPRNNFLRTNPPNPSKSKGPEQIRPCYVIWWPYRPPWTIIKKQAIISHHEPPWTAWKPLRESQTLRCSSCRAWSRASALWRLGDGMAMEIIQNIFIMCIYRYNLMDSSLYNYIVTYIYIFYIILSSLVFDRCIMDDSLPVWIWLIMVSITKE